MKEIKLFGISANRLLFYFISCAFIGWCIETLYMFYMRGRFVSVGLLHFPFNPIYGFGGLLLIIALRPLRHNFILFFLGAVLVTSLLEYVTGVGIKFFLNKMIWNYSGEFLCISGFVCLKSSLAWGMISVIFLYFIKPFLQCLYIFMPQKLRMCFIVSFFAFFTLKITGW